MAESRWRSNEVRHDLRVTSAEIVTPGTAGAVLGFYIPPRRARSRRPPYGQSGSRDASYPPRRLTIQEGGAYG